MNAMNIGSYREEKIYLEDSHKIGAKAMAHIKKAIANNHAVGTVVGYYDEALTILSASDYFLNNLNYSFEQFVQTAKGSLKQICCGKSSCWMNPEQLRGMRGTLEGQMLTGDGTLVDVQIYKTDS